MKFDFHRLNRLPTVPLVAIRLLERFADPDVPIGSVVEIIQQDPAICAKILRAASSSQYGAGKPVADLMRAVVMLGRRNVTSLALCFCLAEDSMRSGPFSELYKNIWLQSILQATTAGLTARRRYRALEGESFALGLLADIGRLAMLKVAPQEYASLMEGDDLDSLEIERREEVVYGITSSQLTAKLLKHWNLPPRFCEAVRRRHLSLQELASLPPGDERSVCHTLAIATAVGEYFCRPSKGLALARVCELGGELFQFSPEDIHTLLRVVQDQVNASSNLFETDASRLGAPSEIMAQAMEQLSVLAAAATDGTASQSVCGQLLDENGQLKQRIQDLVQRTMIDPLTGVANRGHFDDQLTTLTANARLASQPLGLLFIDADHFKRVNDTHGHAVGDIVLKRIADVLTQYIRTGDLVARYGGEEFVILVANPTAPALWSLADRLRLSIEQQQITVGTDTVRVTVSVGGAYFEPPHNHDVLATLPATADAALYTAKRNGRNRVEIRTGEQPTAESPAPAPDPAPTSGA